MKTESEMTDSEWATQRLRWFLIKHMEALGYHAEWALLTDEQILVQAAELLGEDD
jgi:hypothetical protein